MRTPDDLMTHLEAMGFVHLGQFWQLAGFVDPVRVVHDVFSAWGEATWCEVSVEWSNADLTLVTVLDDGGAVVTYLAGGLFPGQPQEKVRLFVDQSETFPGFWAAHRRNVARCCGDRHRPLALEANREEYVRTQTWLVRRWLEWQRLMVRRQATMLGVGLFTFLGYALVLHVAAGVEMSRRTSFVLMALALVLGGLLTVLLHAANRALMRRAEARLDRLAR